LLALKPESRHLSAMEATVEDLLNAAMKLSAESRTDLVEAILERSTPTGTFVADQMEVVTQRMERVRQGESQPISAAEAHETILSGLKFRA
jgi:hypothetical protein